MLLVGQRIFSAYFTNIWHLRCCNSKNGLSRFSLSTFFKKIKDLGRSPFGVGLSRCALSQATPVSPLRASIPNARAFGASKTQSDYGPIGPPDRRSPRSFLRRQPCRPYHRLSLVTRLIPRT